MCNEKGALRQFWRLLALAAALSAGPVLAQEQRGASVAPTLEQLADLRMKERLAEAKARHDKLFPPPTPASAPTKAVVKVVRPMANMPASQHLKLLGIHGRIGSESADLERTNGSVVTVRKGSVIDGLRVVDITKGTLHVERRTACPAPSGAAPKRGSQRASQSSTACTPRAEVAQIAVGGLFR